MKKEWDLGHVTTRMGEPLWLLENDAKNQK